MLKTLSLSNFKAFGYLQLQLGTYTLLSGLNSSGKSSVFQSIALLRQSEGALRDPRSGGLQLNGELVELGTGRDVLHESYVVAAPDESPRITFSVATDQSEYAWSVVVRERDREGDLLPLAAAESAVSFPAEIFGPGFQYLHADRISPAPTYPRSYEYAVRRGFLGVHGEHTANFVLSFDGQLRSRSLLREDAQSRNLQDQAQAWLQDICPGVSLETGAIDGTDLVRLRYGFGRGGLGASEQYRPTNVGFGLTYVLPIVVACLAAQPGALIMIENPEAHLHPRGQTAIARLTCAAAAAGAQVIVETHSDHVLNGARLAVKSGLLQEDDVVLHFFRRTATRSEPVLIDVVTPTVGADGMISEWPEGFFDEFGRSLDQLLD
jgi:predicted ATPase